MVYFVRQSIEDRNHCKDGQYHASFLCLSNVDMNNAQERTWHFLP
jgi:hypothetical protein